MKSSGKPLWVYERATSVTEQIRKVTGHPSFSKISGIVVVDILIMSLPQNIKNHKTIGNKAISED